MKFRLKDRFIKTLLFGTHLYKLLGFAKVVEIYKISGLDKGWVWYLKNREKIPSYFYSLLGFSLIKKSDTVLDFGCGAGQMLPEMGKHVMSGKVIAIESSGLSLLFAEKFFSRPNTKLLKFKFKNKLPFNNNSINVIHSNDTFQYLKNKRAFLRESIRVLKSGGRLVVLQTLSKSQGNILGIHYKKVKQLLSTTGFKHVSFYSNISLLNIIKDRGVIELGKSDTLKNLENAFSYSFFAVKGVRKFKIKVSDKLLKRLQSTKINYSQEAWLQH